MPESIYSGIVMGRQDQENSRARRQALDIQAQQSARADAQAAQQQQAQDRALQARRMQMGQQDQANKLLSRADFLEEVADPDAAWPDIQDRYADVIKSGKFTSIAEDTNGTITFMSPTGGKSYTADQLKQTAKDLRVRAAMMMNPANAMRAQATSAIAQQQMDLKGREFNAKETRAEREMRLKEQDLEDKKGTRKSALDIETRKLDLTKADFADKQAGRKQRQAIDEKRFTLEQQKAETGKQTEADRRKYDRLKMLTDRESSLLSELNGLRSSYPKDPKSAKVKDVAVFDTNIARVERDLMKLRNEMKTEMQGTTQLRNLTEEQFKVLFNADRKRDPTASEIRRAKAAGMIKE